MIHLLKSNVDTALQAMPLGVKNAGLVLGSVGIFAMGLINIHCMQMLVAASHDLCNKLKINSLDFAEVTYHTLMIGPPKLRPYAKTGR
jgi:hypothetical protein